MPRTTASKKTKPSTVKTTVKKKQSQKKSTPRPSAPASTVAGNHEETVSVKKRRLPAAQRHWYNPRSWRTARPKPNYRPLPKARQLLASASALVRQYPRPFLAIAGVYAAAILILVGGVVASKELSAIKEVITTNTPGFGGKIQSSVVQYLYLLGGSDTATTSSGGLYQLIILTICSLAVIWLLRELTAGRLATAKDAFYNGMRPLVPLLAVLAVIFVQLLPLSLGGFIYNTAVSGSLLNQPIAVGGTEKFIAVLAAVGLGIWSVRMVVASSVALYIVTLPDMTPLRALRHARELVYKRRLLILRKVAYVLVIAVLIVTAIELPLVFFLTPLAPWVFFLLGAGLFVAAHVYFYTLYRELLK